MNEQLEKLLIQVQKGEITPKDALKILKDLPYEDLGFAKIDHHRELRRGFPEVIFGEGKTDAQILKIAKAIVKKGSNLLITRVGPKVHKKIKQQLPKAHYNSLAKTIYLKQSSPPAGKGRIVIITAGTSDIPVAEEAAVTCEILGNDIDRIYDVGVAGLHRLFGELDTIKKARVIITVAGMEGALPSVIAGITEVPIIAVPTSIGYGTSFHGIAALLAMLNSCPGGLAVVNIDNGFGAAYMASLINHL
ncbi:MAG: nickel pincer cofactor biosynthesis protein LarB [Candidatus Aminicenantes bacterium]|jgi:NCAIR mutase (PurE)-related protein